MTEALARNGKGTAQRDALPCPSAAEAVGLEADAFSRGASRTPEVAEAGEEAGGGRRRGLHRLPPPLMMTGLIRGGRGGEGPCEIP